MARPAVVPIHTPRGDDRPLWDINFGLHAWPAILVAHELKLFPLLAEQSRSAEEVGESLNIPERSAEALLLMATAAGFLDSKEGRYELTAVGEDYLLESSPTYYGWYLDLLVANHKLFSYEGMRQAVLTGVSPMSGDQEWIKPFVEGADLARAFARGMHSLGMGGALAWPEAAGVSAHRVMLDIAGGTGVHCIGATSQYADLRAIVFDLPPVCETAREFIAQYGLQDRVSTHPGNMWEDPFPSADLHFYSNIYHDWPPERCQFLTQKSYESLEPGGRIVIHEMVYNDAKTGPFSVAAMNTIMLSWTDGQQYSGPELSSMLAEAGFVDIAIRPTFGYWSIVAARKP